MGSWQLWSWQHEGGWLSCWDTGVFDSQAEEEEGDNPSLINLLDRQPGKSLE